MVFAGYPDDKKIDDVIAYLASKKIGFSGISPMGLASRAGPGTRNLPSAYRRPSPVRIRACVLITVLSKKSDSSRLRPVTASTWTAKSA